MENPGLQKEDPEVPFQAVPTGVAGKRLTETEDKLARAQYPLVEKSLFYSVTNNIQVLSSIIFPIMGPAIRKAIQDAMKKLVQQINESSRESLSPRSIQWRIQAMVTGRSYGEILLKNALLYRVEHVFLIHKETALLLRQASHKHAIEQQSDMISAMLSAIRDFARDSFQVEETEELHEIKVGSQSVWIEGGPYMILAAVIRGEAPVELRDKLTETVEQIHRDYHEDLTKFSGDTTPFELVRPLLEQCLTSQEKRKKGESDASLGIAGRIGPENSGFLGKFKRALAQPVVKLLIFLLLALSTFLFFRIQSGSRWNRYVRELEETPGIVLVREARSWNTFRATLLIDPIAADPGTLAVKYKIKPNKVKIKTIPYVSADPEILIKRMRRQFSIPPEVKVSFMQNKIVIYGAAQWEWLTGFRKSAGQLPPDPPVDMSGLYNPEEEKIKEIRDEVYRTSFRFISETTDLFESDDVLVNHFNQQLAWLDRLSRILTMRWTLSIVGMTDSTPSSDEGIKLALERANKFLKLLPGDLTQVSYRTFWSVRQDTLLNDGLQKDLIFALTENSPQ